MTASKHCPHFLHLYSRLSLVAPPNPRAQTSQDLLKSKPICSIAAFTILKLWTIGYQDVGTPHFWVLAELQESRHLAGPPETLWMNRTGILMFVTLWCLWHTDVCGSRLWVFNALSHFFSLVYVCWIHVHVWEHTYMCVHLQYWDSPSFSEAESPIQI